MKMFHYVILLLIMHGFILNLHAIEYHVDTKNKNNNVKFISNATLEDFEGVTDKIDGYLATAEGDGLYGAKIYFEVDLNSIDTGIGLRNRHMREDYLHTDDYPFTSFEGIINEVKKIDKTTYDVRVKGKIMIHGESKELWTRGKIKFLKNGINIQSDFSVKLSDHNIKVPKVMFMKINEEIKVVLDFNMIEVY